MRSLSAVEVPCLRPASISACFSQPRNDSVPMPSSLATRVTTPKRWPPCSSINSCAIRTARSRSGASGCQIGDELLRAGRTVFLSVSRHRRVPRRFRGKDVYWWLDRMGRFAQTIDSFPGRRWPPSTVVTGVSGGYDINVRQMAADGIHVLGRVEGASNGVLALARNANEILDEADEAFATFVDAAREFAAASTDPSLADEEPIESAALPATLADVEDLDLQRENVAAIVWATGYDYDYGWLRVPVLDSHGRPLQQRGVTQVQGLYFLGLHWMHAFKSGLFSGVGSDAQYIAEHMSLSAPR
jgi:putative flavoprotein involved in K+ transport